MAGMGPPPKPADQRRSRVKPLANVMKLPAEGRKGDPAPWPYPMQSEWESDVWRELWATPMAVAWERLGWTRQVARYVKVLQNAEELSMPALIEARQLEDRLGLNPLALVRLRWEITVDEVAEVRNDRAQQERRLSAIKPKTRMAGSAGEG